MLESTRSEPSLERLRKNSAGELQLWVTSCRIPGESSREAGSMGGMFLGDVGTGSCGYLDLAG